MARIRSIHPEACESEKLLALSDGAERTLWRLTTHSDDAGRGLDNPKLLAAKLYPLDDAKNAEVIDYHLAELAEADMLVRFEVDGKRYYEIHDFTDWQKPRHVSDSKLPPPPDVRCSADDVGHTSDVRPDPPHGVVDGEGVGEHTPSSADADGTPDPFVEFWQVCPRKVGKAEAERRFRRACRDVDGQVLIDAMRTHAERWLADSTDHRFIPHPATWLNQGRWTDELVPQDTGPPEFRPNPVLERNARRAAGDACPDCADTGWIDSEDPVRPCPCQAREAAG